MDHFTPKEWYVKSEPQLQSRRHQIVEAIDSETYGVHIERHKYNVRVVGFWDPEDNEYDFEDINQFKMILPDFNKKKWKKLTQAEKNEIMMRKFQED